MSRTKHHVKTLHGGEYIRCECGVWFVPVFENQVVCVKCKRKARYEECHKYAPSILVVV